MINSFTACYSIFSQFFMRLDIRIVLRDWKQKWYFVNMPFAKCALSLKRLYQSVYLSGIQNCTQIISLTLGGCIIAMSRNIYKKARIMVLLVSNRWDIILSLHIFEPLVA